MSNTDMILVQSDKDDITIYDSDIAVSEEKYLNTLNNPEMIYKSSNMFLGLLNYVYRYNLQYINIYSSDSTKNKTRYNFKVLDNIFNNIYCMLCSKYNKTITIIGFCAFIGISEEIICDIYQGGTKASNEDRATIKKWFAKTKQASLNRAIDENSIGAIFNLKANYGMVEQAAPQQVIVSDRNLLSLESLSNMLPVISDNKTE